MTQSNFIPEVGIIQVIVIVLLVFLIIYLIKQKRLNRYEKRIEAFALFSDKEREKSLFDKIYDSLEYLIQVGGIHLQRVRFISFLAQKYERYIRFEDRHQKSIYDFVSIKMFTAISLGILSFITMMFQYTQFNFGFFLVILVIGFYLPDFFWKISFQKVRKQIETDLLKAIIIMNNAFKSGSNITQAVGIVKDQLTGPISDEFKKIYIDINYGLSLDVVFGRFYERVKIEDVKYVTNSLTLLNKTGGNIVKVFSLIEKTFYDRKKLKNEYNSLTASSLFIFKTLLALPVILIVLILALNPTYFKPFFTSKIGLLCLIILVLLYCLYVVVIKQIIKVKI